MNNLAYAFQHHVVDHVSNHPDELYRKLFEVVFGNNNDPLELLSECFSNTLMGFSMVLFAGIYKEELGTDQELCKARLYQLTDDILELRRAFPYTNEDFPKHEPTMLFHMFDQFLETLKSYYDGWSISKRDLDSLVQYKSGLSNCFYFGYTCNEKEAIRVFVKEKINGYSSIQFTVSPFYFYKELPDLYQNLKTFFNPQEELKFYHSHCQNFFGTESFEKFINHLSEARHSRTSKK